MAAANPLPPSTSADEDFKIHHYSHPRPAAPGCEKVMAVGFYVVLLTQLALGFTCIANKNGALSMEMTAENQLVDCPEGMTREDLNCYSDDLIEEQKACEEKNGARQLSSTSEGNNLWAFCERNIGVVAGVFGGMVAVAVLWILALRKAAKFVVWGTLASCVAMLFIVPMSVGAEPQYIGAGILCALLLAARKQITVAAQIIQQACVALEENPSIWLHCTIVQALYAGYLIFWVASMMASVNIYEVDASCEFKVVSGAIPLEFMVFAFVFTSAFFDNAKTIVTAVTISHWYFPSAGQENAAGATGARVTQKDSGSPGFTGIRWAFVDMSGAGSVAAVIATLVQFIRQHATNKCLCWTTAGIFWLLWKCVEGCLQQFVRFALIGGVISGKPFFGAARWSYDCIKKHLGQGIVTGSVAATVMGVMAYILSTAIAIAAIEAGRAAQDLNSMAADMGVLFQFFTVFLAYLVSKPYVMIILMGFIGTWDVGQDYVALLFGIFIGSIATIFFRFVAQFVLNSTDVIFMCFCLERARGHGQTERFTGLYSMIKEHIADGTVAQNIEVGRPVGEAGVAPGGAAPQHMAQGQPAEKGEEQAGGA